MDEELAKLAGWSAEAIRMTRFIMKHGEDGAKKDLRKRRPKESLRNAYEGVKSRLRHKFEWSEEMLRIRKVQAKILGTDVNLSWDGCESIHAEIETRRKEFYKDRDVIGDIIKETAGSAKAIADFIMKLDMFEEALGREELEELFQLYKLESSIESLSEKIAEFKKFRSSKKRPSQ